MENVNNLDDLEIADDWKSPIFRQRIVIEMENIIQQSDLEVALKSAEMENRVFSKVKTREEYLKTMAKIIVYLKNIYIGFNSNQVSFNKQGEPESNPDTRVSIPDGTTLTRAQASWITKQPDLINECIIDLKRYFATLGFGHLLKDSGNEDWKSIEFRQVVVAKIDNEFQKSGLEIARDSTFMENHVFLRAKSCPEYLKMVSKLFVYVRELAQQKLNPDPDVIYLMDVKTHQNNPWLAKIKLVK